jgi:hypothetical protein
MIRTSRKDNLPPEGENCQDLRVYLQFELEVTKCKECPRLQELRKFLLMILAGLGRGQEGTK